MEHRHLGRSGLKISEIIYGNWLTHASQVEDERARACVRAALDAGISTFDAADTYANTAAEVVLGEALKGERRESLEIFTKVYFPTGRKGHNDTGLSRKHIRESIDGSLSASRPTTWTSTRRIATTTPPRSRRRCRPSPTSSTPGKALYIGVSEWNADQLRAGHQLARELGIQLISNQPQYSMLWRVIEERVVHLPRARHLADRVVARRRASSPASTSRAPRRPRARAPAMRRAART